MPYNTAAGYRKAILYLCMGEYSYNSDILLIAPFCDTAALFQIIIFSYCELSSRGNDGEEDVFKRMRWTLRKVLLNINVLNLVP